MQSPNIAATISYVISEHVRVIYLHIGLQQKSLVSETLPYTYKSLMLNYQNFNVIIVCPLHTYNSTTGLQNRDCAGILCPTLQHQSANLQPSISAHWNTAVLRLTQPGKKKIEKSRACIQRTTRISMPCTQKKLHMHGSVTESIKIFFYIPPLQSEFLMSFQKSCPCPGSVPSFLSTAAYTKFLMCSLKSIL